MTRPNILILHADQLRYDSMGCAGNPHARTPNLDRLATEGTFCSRHISSSPVCMPSRASLLTGLYPPGHNLWINGVALNRREYVRFDPRCSPTEVVSQPATVADVFADAGYDTSLFGKPHMTPYLAPAENSYPESYAMWKSGRMDDWRGPYYGFQHAELTIGHGEDPCHMGHYALWLKREHPEALEALTREDRSRERPVPQQEDCFASTLPFDLHNSAWLADRFSSYLREERPSGKPFLSFIGFPDPHHPFTPCEETARQFADAPVPDPVDPDGEAWEGLPSLMVMQHRLRGFTAEDRRMIIRYTYAMVHQIDRAVGRIVEALRATGELDNTIIVFTGDHGDFLCDHGMLYKGYGAADALLHVPLIIRAPGGGLPPRIDAPVSNCDVLPTLTALAGIATPDALHGSSLTEDPESDTRTAMAFCNPGDPRGNNYTIYDRQYRFTIYPGLTHTEFFDHRTDAGECVNRAQDDTCRTRRNHLLSELRTRFLEISNPILGRVCAW